MNLQPVAYITAKKRCHAAGNWAIKMVLEDPSYSVRFRWYLPSGEKYNLHGKISIFRHIVIRFSDTFRQDGGFWSQLCQFFFQIHMFFPWKRRTWYLKLWGIWVVSEIPQKMIVVCWNHQVHVFVGCQENRVLEQICSQLDSYCFVFEAPLKDQLSENGFLKSKNLIRLRISCDSNVLNEFWHSKISSQEIHIYTSLMLTAPFCKWFWSGWNGCLKTFSQGIWSTRAWWVWTRKGKTQNHRLEKVHPTGRKTCESFQRWSTNYTLRFIIPKSPPKKIVDMPGKRWHLLCFQTMFFFPQPPPPPPKKKKIKASKKFIRFQPPSNRPSKTPNLQRLKNRWRRGAPRRRSWSKRHWDCEINEGFCFFGWKDSRFEGLKIKIFENCFYKFKRGDFQVPCMLSVVQSSCGWRLYSKWGVDHVHSEPPECSNPFNPAAFSYSGWKAAPC